MTPTPELLRATFTQYAVAEGYRILREQGYEVSRAKCRHVRSQLTQEGIVKRDRLVWPDDKVEQVREMASKGLTSTQIADALGVNRHSLYDMCMRRGIAFRKGAPVKRTASRDDVAAAYEGRSMRDAAQMMGVSEHLFSRWVHEHGLTRERPLPPAKPTKPRLVPGTSKRRYWGTSAALPPSDDSALGLAAMFLRRHGYSNVYRLNHHEWQVGRLVMSERGMLARVEEIKARQARMMGDVA